VAAHEKRGRKKKIRTCLFPAIITDTHRRIAVKLPMHTVSVKVTPSSRCISNINIAEMHVKLAWKRL